ncbi:hypothetical protein KL86DES1_10924 [uncultured Desulfovibrio sp.]|uniref:Uncharacterized protein n=1 Tax=uncultured Desulfovibrio sp. TaxID=167968 RepID=A0A212L124_9BACT|nr:hypothetical protein KL86DES1_10924 [uncultured Desulfovibrio sp.]VZH32796.1 conserved protein of unknown function [Desulfovibrio sp. 86]
MDTINNWYLMCYVLIFSILTKSVTIKP